VGVGLSTSIWTHERISRSTRTHLDRDRSAHPSDDSPAFHRSADFITGTNVARRNPIAESSLRACGSHRAYVLTRLGCARPVLAIAIERAWTSCIQPLWPTKALRHFASAAPAIAVDAAMTFSAATAVGVEGLVEMAPYLTAPPARPIP
jgi:hypothetical protein